MATDPNSNITNVSFGIDQSVNGTTNKVVAELESGDIEIGAVELKDGTTDVRQNVELDVAKNASYVQSESLASESTVSTLALESGGNLDTIAGDTTSIDGKVALAATQTDKSQMTQISNGTNEADIEQAADDSTDLEDKYGLVNNSILNARISNTAIRPLRADSSTHSIQIIDYEHHEIHSGDHYFVAGVQDLAINNVLDFTWQMPNTTKWIHWTFNLKTESETLWYVYETAVATNPLANAVTPYNSDRNSANTSGTTMKFEKQTNLAGANADTDVTGATAILTGISGAGKDAGFEDRASEIILKQNTLYCLRAVATAAGYINFNMQWYEHTNKN
jgi:hypothetical protein